MAKWGSWKIGVSLGEGWVGLGWIRLGWHVGLVELGLVYTYISIYKSMRKSYIRSKNTSSLPHHTPYHYMEDNARGI